MTDQKNLIIALVLSFVILMGFQFFYEIPRMEAEKARQAELAAEQSAAIADGTSPSVAPTPGAPATGTSAPAPGDLTIGTDLTRAQALEQTPRIAIETPTITGSLSLKGARIDDVVLRDYKETLQPDSQQIHLLEPTGLRKPYYAEFGWVAAPNSAVKLPNADTVWTTGAAKLTPETPITLSWDNGEGLVFERTISVDAHYMFSVEQKIRNTGAEQVTLFPYGLLSRGGIPETIGFYILHEGPIGVFDETLQEVDYDDLQEDGDVVPVSEQPGGWIGITDKYWLAALVPNQEQSHRWNFKHAIRNQVDRFQVDYLGDGIAIPAGGESAVTNRLFAGAKVLDLLEGYETEFGVKNFDLAIDFGWFYFLTKPFFHVLTFLNGVLGNFGLAILALTVVIKLVFFPLANKSYRSMAKMKKLTPKLSEMREKYGDDKQRLNQEMMQLYKTEKVNPAAGCLPILVQIPVFFALYKVLFVSIEMRHAPFYGWIKDLSAPDPTSLFNLFGMIPWDPPQMLMIGAWPVLMGVTMFLQQRLNPQPTDPVQAKVFMFLPLMFTVLLASFAAGLVIYWTWNNLLSILQQWVIMKRMGVKA
jgi:YidC/Oxa1 family membrane protein insertase